MLYTQGYNTDIQPYIRSKFKSYQGPGSMDKVHYRRAKRPCAPSTVQVKSKNKAGRAYRATQLQSIKSYLNILHLLPKYPELAASLNLLVSTQWGSDAYKDAIERGHIAEYIEFHESNSTLKQDNLDLDAATLQSHIRMLIIALKPIASFMSIIECNCHLKAPQDVIQLLSEQSVTSPQYHIVHQKTSVPMPTAIKGTHSIFNQSNTSEEVKYCYSEGLIVVIDDILNKQYIYLYGPPKFINYEIVTISELEQQDSIEIPNIRNTVVSHEAYLKAKSLHDVLCMNKYDLHKSRGTVVVATGFNSSIASILSLLMMKDGYIIANTILFGPAKAFISLLDRDLSALHIMNIIDSSDIICEYPTSNTQLYPYLHMGETITVSHSEHTLNRQSYLETSCMRHYLKLLEDHNTSVSYQSQCLNNKIRSKAERSNLMHNRMAHSQDTNSSIINKGGRDRNNNHIPIIIK